jgi:hypothetical protein
MVGLGEGFFLTEPASNLNPECVKENLAIVCIFIKINCRSI